MLGKVGWAPYRAMVAGKCRLGHWSPRYSSPPFYSMIQHGGSKASKLGNSNQQRPLLPLVEVTSAWVSERKNPYRWSMSCHPTPCHEGNAVLRPSRPGSCWVSNSPSVLFSIHRVRKRSRHLIKILYPYHPLPVIKTLCSPLSVSLSANTQPAELAPTII